MTSPNPGLHRAGLVILAAGAAIGLSACGAGQISQTANQVAAVDGGSATTSDISVNDVRLVVPNSESGTTGSATSTDATVAFTASYAGAASDGGITLTKVSVNGQAAQLPAVSPILSACSLVSAPAANSTAVPQQDKSVCIKNTTVTLPGSNSLSFGQQVPVEFTFTENSSGQPKVVKASASIVATHLVAGEYTRPAEEEPSAGH